MSIADKFNNFEVKRESRISEADKNYLEHYQDLYERALTYYKRVYSLYKEEDAKYTNTDRETFRYKDILVSNFDIFKIVNNLQTSYINDIYSYFQRNYNVKLDYDNAIAIAHEKYKHTNGYSYITDEEIRIKFLPQHYEPIVDDILSQIGGLSFKDTAIKQLKERMRAAAYNSYHNKWNFTIKGNTIKYADGYCSKNIYSDHYELHKNDFVNSIFECINMYLYGRKGIIAGLKDGWDCYELYEEDFQNGITYSDECQISKIKFYKNGNFEIKFKTPEDARYFARNWLGYTLV